MHIVHTKVQVVLRKKVGSIFACLPKFGCPYNFRAWLLYCLKLVARPFAHLSLTLLVPFTPRIRPVGYPPSPDIPPHPIVSTQSWHPSSSHCINLVLTSFLVPLYQPSPDILPHPIVSAQSWYPSSSHCINPVLTSFLIPLYQPSPDILPRPIVSTQSWHPSSSHCIIPVLTSLLIPL
jgi:hypothetical protein